MGQNQKTNWDASFYDSKHAYVAKYGGSLVEWLGPEAGEKICDIGCGTGDLAKKISESNVHITAIDSSASMIKEACNKYPELSFQVHDARKLSFDSEFDAVFSNAALHWIKESDLVIAGVYKSLKPGGRFVSESGGEDNIKHIVESIYNALDQFNFAQNKIKNPWKFSTVSEYTFLLEKQGFKICEIICYDRLTELDDGENGLRNWINMFAGFFFENVPEQSYHQMLECIENDLRPQLFNNGKWHADYKRLRFKAQKPF